MSNPLEKMEGTSTFEKKSEEVEKPEASNVELAPGYEVGDKIRFQRALIETDNVLLEKYSPDENYEVAEIKFDGAWQVRLEGEDRGWIPASLLEKTPE